MGGLLNAVVVAVIVAVVGVVDDVATTSCGTASEETKNRTRSTCTLIVQKLTTADAYAAIGQIARLILTQMHSFILVYSVCKQIVLLMP